MALAPLETLEQHALDRQRAVGSLDATRHSVLRGLAAGWCMTGGRISLPGAVPLAVPPGGYCAALGVSQLALDADEVTSYFGLPCSSAARTAADILRSEPRWVAVAAVDAITNCCVATVADIELALNRRPRQRGLVRARALLDEVEPNAQSRPETLLRLLMTDGGLPRPVAQMLLFARDGEFLGRSDLGYERLRLAIEYLGRLHALTLEADAERRNALTLGGVLTLEVTNRAMRQPTRFIDRVLAAGHRQHEVLGLPGTFELS